jgi:hypothetical protein
MSMIETIGRSGGTASLLAELTMAQVPPAGWRRVIYAAIDQLQASSAPDEQINVAERISVSLLQLEWAVQRGDDAKQDKARQQLSALRDSWHLASAPQLQDDVLELREVETISEALERLNGQHW